MTTDRASQLSLSKSRRLAKNHDNFSKNHGDLLKIFFLAIAISLLLVTFNMWYVKYNNIVFYCSLNAVELAPFKFSG